MKILFVAEAVTLAQVVRLFVLARGAQNAGHEVHFASALFDERIFHGSRIPRWKIRSIDARTVERRVARGARVHRRRELDAYVDEELRLFAELRPDLVVGDLRPSLSVSAPLAGVRQATLINAYWSPFAERARFPMPDHPIVRLLGVERAERSFPQALPFVFAHFARPVNALRRAHGLSEIGSLLEVLTHGDLVLHPDVPAIAPTHGAPENHVYLGPIHWSPSIEAPFDFDAPRSRPRVYATLGSSGKIDLLPALLDAIATLDVDAIVATAGRARPKNVPRNARLFDFVPGDRVARASDVVVSNGGSTTGYQALAEATPIVGLPFNLDQYLASSAIASTGASVVVRGGSATREAIRSGISRVIGDRSLQRAASRLRDELSRWDAVGNFLRAIA